MLAVADIDRALAFYRDGLGLECEGVSGTPASSAIPTDTSGRSSGTCGCSLSHNPDRLVLEQRASVHDRNSDQLARSVEAQRMVLGRGIEVHPLLCA